MLGTTPLILGAQSSQSPIATVNGQAIYEDELISVAGPSLLELRNQEYKIKSDALEKLVIKKLFEVEAKKKGLTVEQLLQQEVDAKIPDPSDDEAKGYYLAGKDQSTLPFNDIKDQVKRLLKALEIQQARQNYADALRAKAEIAVMLRAPKLEVAYDPARVKGDAKAQVTIVEFADFQCPYCRKVQSTLNSLLEEYHGKVKLAYRDFPLDALHPNARIAAEASRCAGEKGKFWEFHDALYSDQTKLSQPELLATAKKLGLDEKAFQACLVSGKFKPQIEQDVRDGSKVGVDGTPGFYINGVFLNGAVSAAEFEKVINTELRAAGDQNSMRASH
jgi:protein-disulfide isomerase